MRDIHNEMRVVLNLVPQILTGTDDSSAAVAVDHQGFQAVEHIVALGTSGDVLSGTVKLELVLEESDDNVTFTAVTAADAVLGVVDASGVFMTIDDAAGDEAEYRVGYIGSKRYSRVVVNKVGAHVTGTAVSVLSLLGMAEIKPVN